MPQAKFAALAGAIRFANSSLLRGKKRDHQSGLINRGRHSRL